jgi:hypothetical protein
MTVLLQAPAVPHVSEDVAERLLCLMANVQRELGRGRSAAAGSGQAVRVLRRPARRTIVRRASRPTAAV